MNKFNLSLEDKELEFLLNTLAKEPYASVFELIRNIQGQIQTQLKENSNSPSE